MSFLVQEMLDYAQIKAGKFRKQTKAFNIREAIEKVMCIQRKKAQDQGIRFYATYTNIHDSQPNALDGKHSPMIMADEQRIQ